MSCAVMGWTPVSIASNFTIRRLGGGDSGALHALNRLYSDAFAEPENYCAQPPSDAYADRLLVDERVILLVAEADRQIIGGLTAYVLPKPEQERSEIYVYDLAIAADFRRMGIATRLLSELQPIGKEHGCWCIYVQAEHGDDPAFALYRKLGSANRVWHFDLDRLPTL